MTSTDARIGTQENNGARATAVQKQAELDTQARQATHDATGATEIAELAATAAWRFRQATELDTELAWARARTALHQSAMAQNAHEEAPDEEEEATWVVVRVERCEDGDTDVTVIGLRASCVAATELAQRQAEQTVSEWASDEGWGCVVEAKADMAGDNVVGFSVIVKDRRIVSWEVQEPEEDVWARMRARMAEYAEEGARIRLAEAAQ